MGWIAGEWRQWTFCGADLVKLTEGQDSRRRPPVGLARVWGTFGWLVDEDEVGGPVADAAFRTRVAGRAAGPGHQ